MRIIGPKKIKRVVKLLMTLDERIEKWRKRDNPNDWVLMYADIFFEILEILGGHKAVKSYIFLDEERRRRAGEPF